LNIDNVCKLYQACLLGNSDIDFFTKLLLYSHIMRLQFVKFERDQNIAEKNCIGINENEKLQNAMKMDEIIIENHLLLASNLSHTQKIHPCDCCVSLDPVKSY
jgi:hypothetical protein